MKIDLHCHTKKTKSDEATTRNVTKEIFKEKIETSGVEIVAITNHNHFDKEQYLEFQESVKDTCQLWPGIELDVFGATNKPGHLILISNPNNVNEFNDKIEEILDNKTPDEFIIELNSLYDKVKELDLIYVTHCFKTKELPFSDIEEFEKTLLNKNRLFREPATLTSVTILQSNKYRVIMGTDVIDWSKYEEYDFGELKFAVKDYNSFIKLIEKDLPFLADAINEQFSENIKVYGTADTKEHPFALPIFNDINIIFGDKGSGKSEILKSLYTYYSVEKNEEPVYYVSSNREVWYSNLIKSKDEDYNISNMENTYDCSSEIKEINDFIDTNPITIKSYYDYFDKKTSKASKERMKCLNINKSNLYDKTKYEFLYSEHENVANFIMDLRVHQTKLDFSEQNKLENLLTKLYSKSFIEASKEWIKQKTEYLFDDFVENLPQYVSQFTGEPVQPVKTGFFDFAKGRLGLCNNAKKIISALNNSNEESKYIGDLGEKGKVFLQHDYILLNNDNKDCISSARTDAGSKYILSSSNKGNLESFITELNRAAKNYYSYSLDLTTFKDLYSTKNIKTLSEFIAVKKYFKIESSLYVPSSGEKSILALQHDFLSKSNKNIFLIDEPELGLGSAYINDSIIPLLKDLAKSKKIIVIATHDANIAVRTRPLNSILKLTHNNTYKTYVGNMFTNILTNIDDDENLLSWKDESIKYLEGGASAFEERGELYE